MRNSHLKKAAKRESEELYIRTLEEIADEFLTEEGCEDIADLIESGGLWAAEAYLCTAIDCFFFGKQISEERAADLYLLLGVPRSYLEVTRQEQVKIQQELLARASWKEREQKHRKFDTHRVVH